MELKAIIGIALVAFIIGGFIFLQIREKTPPLFLFYRRPKNENP